MPGAEGGSKEEILVFGESSLFRIAETFEIAQKLLWGEKEKVVIHSDVFKCFVIVQNHLIGKGLK